MELKTCAYLYCSEFYEMNTVDWKKCGFCGYCIKDIREKDTIEHI